MRSTAFRLCAAALVVASALPALAFVDLTGGKRLSARNDLVTGTRTRLAVRFSGDANLATVPSPLCPTPSALRITTPAGVIAQTLDCARWRAAGTGYRYADTPGGPGSARKLAYKPGRLSVRLKGQPYATAPVSGPVAFVETALTIGTTTYCGRWGDVASAVKRNDPLAVVLKGPSAACQVVCGDGIVQAPEACDDGNTWGGDCCAGDCTLEADGSPCTDLDGCTSGDACQAGLCVGERLAPWINEFDYDDYAAFPNDDRDEFVEIAGPAGTDLSGYQIVVVEGKGGECATPPFSSPGHSTLVAFIPPGTVLGDDTGTGIGFLVACFTYTSAYVPGCDVMLPGVAFDSNLNNGHLTNADLFSCPDGILLLDASGNFVDAVSYEGQVPNVGPYGPFFHLHPPYVAERDEGWLAGVSIEKVTSTLARATSAAEWRDPSELGAPLCAGQIGLTCPTHTRTPGDQNPGQTLACGSPSGAFLD